MCSTRCLHLRRVYFIRKSMICVFSRDGGSTWERYKRSCDTETINNVPIPPLAFFLFLFFSAAAAAAAGLHSPISLYQPYSLHFCLSARAGRVGRHWKIFFVIQRHIHIAIRFPLRPRAPLLNPISSLISSFCFFVHADSSFLSRVRGIFLLRHFPRVLLKVIAPEDPKSR